MAANDGLIEGLAPGVLVELQAYNKEIVTAMGNIPKLNDFLKNTKTPAQADGSFKALTDQIKAQDKAIADLQKKLLGLADTQRKTNQVTAEEAVGRQILTNNAKQQAMATIGLAGAYRNLSAQQAIAARKVQDLIANGKKAEQSQRSYNRELKQAQKEFDELNKRVLKADQAVGKFNRNVGNYPKAAFSFAKDLIGAFGIVTGIGAIAAVTSNIYENIKAQQSLDLALKSVTKTEEELARARTYLNKLSQEQGLEINNLTKQYTAFYVAATGKLSDAKIEQVFEDIARSGAALGLSNEALERSFTAVNQMLSKGTVSAEELRGQLAESLPGAVQAMTKAVQKLHPELKNLTEKDLFELIKQGKILAAEVLPETAKQLALITGADNAQGIETLTKTVNRLSNAWKGFIRQLEEGDGTFSKFLAQSANGAANILKWTTDAIKSQKQLREEERKAYRTDLYTQELDALQALGAGAKAEAEKRKPIIQEQFDQETALVNLLNKRLKTQEKGGAAYLQTLKELKSANNDAYGTAGQLDAINKVLKDVGVNTKKNTELTKEQLAAIEEAAKSRYQRELSDLERSKFIIEQDLKNEELSRDEKMKLQRDLATAEFLIITRKYQEQDRLAKGNFDKMKIAANEYITALDSLAKPTIPFPQAETGFEIPVVDEKQAEDSKQYVQDIIDLFAKWRDEAEASKEIMDDFIGQFTEDVFNNAGMPTLFKILNNEIEGFGENAMVTALAVSEAFQEAFNFMSSLSSQNAEIQKKNLEDSYNTQKSYINASVTDEEDKNEIIAELDRQLAIKKRAIAIKEAKAQKRIAQFNIAIDAAQGIVAAFKDGNIVKGAIFAAFIAGIAAVQLSALNNQQVPEYWKGTDNAPQGWAWTQERGAEIITDRQGRIKTLGSNDGAQLTPMAAGDKVFTADKSKELMNDIYLNRILGERGINNAPSVVNVAAQPAITEQLIQRMERAVTSMPQTIIGLTDRKLKVITKHNNQHIQDMTDRWDGVPKINP